MPLRFNTASFPPRLVERKPDHLTTLNSTSREQYGAPRRGHIFRLLKLDLPRSTTQGEREAQQATPYGYRYEDR